MLPCVAPNTVSNSREGVAAPGAALPPLMFASSELLAIEAIARVPLPVIGPPVRPLPLATLVTVPAPAGLSHTRSAPLPRALRYWPVRPGASDTQPPTVRVRI